MKGTLGLSSPVGIELSMPVSFHGTSQFILSRYLEPFNLRSLRQLLTQWLGLCIIVRMHSSLREHTRRQLLGFSLRLLIVLVLRLLSKTVAI